MNKMINRYDCPIIIIRKKIKGENSIEEIAKRVSSYTKARLVECPCYSNSITGLLKNIKYIRSIEAPIYHIISPAEAYLLPFLRKGKKIITYHDMGTTLDMSRNVFYKQFRILIHFYPSIKYSDIITFVSNYTKDEYINIYPKVKRDKLRVIYNAYDERLVPHDFKKHDKKTIILHIGTAKRKNLDKMILACKDIEVHFIIVGKLTNKQEDALQITGCSYENYVDISFDKIVDFYNKCDIVSFPSSYEGFGVPAIEANVMRKPVILGNIPVLKEVAGDAAVYVNPESQNEIKKAVISLIEDRKLRDSLIIKGIDNARRFSPDIISEQYRALYFCEEK